ncbi:MAG TPA: hypothetical protein PLD40_10405 [Kiritimatiellia bacterium]|jgi:hypothetical protein|nr:hypothetical protein [Kiritimatiellia bacterium]HPV47976.1 hypothetical protein [Kiritimatiellia bacterium]HRV31940.1 hypothetical protein [Kiritimatiellia bacterium]
MMEAFLDVSDMNRRLARQRRHLAAVRALWVVAYSAAAFGVGLLLGMVLAGIGAGW